MVDKAGGACEDGRVMSHRYLIIGLGRFGAALAESLSEQGAEVIAVDTNMAEVEAVKRKVAYAIELDATDPAALLSVDPLRCKAVIVAIGENFEATVLTLAALREVGVKDIVARARSAREARILQAVGATEIIELEAEMGRAYGHRLAVKAAESALAPGKTLPPRT
jgi:trk system potassium uptake protein